MTSSDRLKVPKTIASNIAVSQNQHTLDSRLGTGGGNGAHGSDHEVLEEQVRVGAVLVHVVAEVGDPGGFGFALEGTRVGSGIVELGSRGDGAGGIYTATGFRYSSRQSTGSNGKRCHNYMERGSIGSSWESGEEIPRS